MNIENFNKVISFLEKLEDREFNFQKVITIFNNKLNCGTVCCAVGWFPNIFPERVTWDKTCGSTMLALDKEEVGYGDIAAEILDIPRDHASTLFTPWNEDYDPVDYDEGEDDYIKERCLDVDMKVLPLCHRDSKPSEVAFLLSEYVQAHQETIPELEK
jgi:hypothetical protein